MQIAFSKHDLYISTPSLIVDKNFMNRDDILIVFVRVQRKCRVIVEVVVEEEFIHSEITDEYARKIERAIFMLV